MDSHTVTNSAFYWRGTRVSYHRAGYRDRGRGARDTARPRPPACPPPPRAACTTGSRARRTQRPEAGSCSMRTGTDTPLPVWGRCQWES